MHKVPLAIATLLAVACATMPSDDGGRSIAFLNSGQVLPVNLPFSEAVRVGNTLYLSGQIGIVPGKLELVPGGIS
jgi:enamine deaminase RidA (YjgF/YER057c/UK114 family)